MVAPWLVVPKKLSICPKAMWRAIPEVNPVITADGITATIFPPFKKEAITKIMAARKLVTKTPSTPNWEAIGNRIATMAPEGPLIPKEDPPKIPITMPAMIAVMRPAAPSRPLAMAKARERGRATAATLREAKKSLATPCPE